MSVTIVRQIFKIVNCNIHQKNSQIILITDLKQIFHFLEKKIILDCFCKKSSFFEGEKNFDVHFFAEKSKNHKKMTLPEDSRDVNCKSQEIWSCLVRLF